MKLIINLLRTIKIKFITLYIYGGGNLNLGSGVVFKGAPAILKHKTAVIKIADNVTINSSNYGYHINMFSKCKLYSDRPNAKIRIGANSRIHGTCIHAYNKILIGDNCLIAANTQIADGNGHQLNFDNPPNRINTTDNGKSIEIKDNVWIAAHCIILGGTTIGEGTIITAGSVVRGDVPPNCIFGGNPAKLIKQF